MLPPIWQIGLVGFSLSVFVGVCLLALFMPRRPRIVEGSPLTKDEFDYLWKISRDCDPPQAWSSSRIDIQQRRAEFEKTRETMRPFFEDLQRRLCEENGIDHKPDLAGPTRGVGSQEPALRVFEHRDS